MKFTVAVLLLMLFYTGSLNAQIIISRLDFNASPLTQASVGPDATTLDPDATFDVNGIYMSANCGATKGLDLTIPNTGSFLDVPEMTVLFNFQRDESTAEFFSRGGTRMSMNGVEISIQYRTDDGMGGFVDYGPFNTGYTIPNDDVFREIEFEYEAATGLAQLRVGGVQMWMNDGPDNRDLYWTGAGDMLLGTNMDGNCNGKGYLDYFYISVPGVLDADFYSFEATAEGSDVILKWMVENEENTDQYMIMRSPDGKDFYPIHKLNAENQGTGIYEMQDINPGKGDWYYQITRRDLTGVENSSEVVLVRLEGSGIQVYPNPATTSATITYTGDNKGTVIIRDISGREMNRFGIEDSYQLNTSSWNSGIYMIQCIGESGSEVIRLKVE